jgi:hypothetical protein
VNSFWDYLNTKDLKSTKCNLDLWIKYYFRSKRIDDYYYKFPSKNELHFLTGFIIIWIWLSNIKKIYLKDKFIFLIQYDAWSDWNDWYPVVTPWFFIKCYLKKDFERIYWVKSINELNKEHISIEV